MISLILIGIWAAVVWWAGVRFINWVINYSKPPVPGYYTYDSNGKKVFVAPLPKVNESERNK